MPIPDFQSLMRPLLQFAADGHAHSVRDCLDHLANEFSLSSEERKELLPSGRQEIFTNRVAWAKTHLRMAGLIEASSRGVFRITDRGQQILTDHPQRVDLRILRQQPGYLEARNSKKGKIKKENGEEEPSDDAQTPEEQIEAASVALRDSLGEEILAKMKAASPAFLNVLLSSYWFGWATGAPEKMQVELLEEAGTKGLTELLRRIALD
jgi:restriction system protein